MHTFKHDEYGNEEGVTAVVSRPGSFQRAMFEGFFNLVDPELPSEEQIHFPTTDAIADDSARIEALGGADVCYGGIGWSGHIAFWEPQLGAEFDGDLEAWKRAGARLVELHPMTVMQNALHSFGSDWSWVPPRANTIGPREVLGAKHRSFWLDGTSAAACPGSASSRGSWHGPASEFVPGSSADRADRLHRARERGGRRYGRHELTGVRKVPGRWGQSRLTHSARGRRLAPGWAV